MTILSSSRAALQVQPNVVPMVGLMLLLLITGLVITPNLLTGWEPSLPQTRHATVSPKQSTDITVGIDREGNFYLQGRSLDQGELEPALRAALGSHPDEHVLYLWADGALEYGVIQRAVDIGARYGARIIGLVVY